MAAFKAINIDYVDEENEPEVDNTKEIQIEDALKLYQTALKLHSEGPDSYEQAGRAYDELFKSEIFKYPESYSELRRIELYGALPEPEPFWHDEEGLETGQLVVGGDQAPNTLPQILYLSFKNYGQFVFDLHRSRQLNQQSAEWLSKSLVLRTAKIALNFFTDAVDKDDTDVDLWVRTAAAGNLAGSERIEKFCLEAVFDGEDENAVPIPALEEIYAGQKLRQLAQGLGDKVAIVPASDAGRKKPIKNAVLQKLEPFPYISRDQAREARDEEKRARIRHAARISLSVPERDWCLIGEAIKGYCFSPVDTYDAPIGTAVNIVLPPKIAPGSPLERPRILNQPGSGADAIPAQDDMDISVDQASGNDSIRQAQDGDTIMRETDDQQPSNEPKDNKMDDGQPEANSNQQDGAQEVQVEQAASGQNDVAADDAQPSTTAALPTRKRSTESAGLTENVDNGRSRSKRLRASERGIESAAQDFTRQCRQQLEPFMMADRWLWETIDKLYGKLKVHGLGTLETLQDKIIPTDNPISPGAQDPDIAAMDLLAAVRVCSPDTIAMLMNVNIIDPLAENLRDTELAAFLGYANTPNAQASSKPPIEYDEGISELAETINGNWLHVQDACFLWLECLLSPGCFPSAKGADWSSYRHHQWSKDLKQTVVQMALNLDEYVTERLTENASKLDERLLKNAMYKFTKEDEQLVEMTQTLFELHLDVYSLFKQSRSGVDPVMLVLQKDRVERWSRGARNLMSLRTSCLPDNSKLDELTLRHIWASAFLITVDDNITQEHINGVIQDLKQIFASAGSPCIMLDNNAVMPELSIAAADRELQTMNTKDFFLKIFDKEARDPVTLIENLEPIIEAQASSYQTEKQLNSTESGHINGSERDTPPNVELSSPSEQMVKYFEDANVTLRLFLWQRLRLAYEAIDYAPKVMSCYLRSIEVVVKEVMSTTYRDAAKEQRGLHLMRWIRTIDDLLEKILALAFSPSDGQEVFECIDVRHVQSSLGALAELSRLLHSFTIFEDLIRIGHIPPPAPEGRTRTNFGTIASRFHDMQIRSWVVQYLLLIEGARQSPENFPNPGMDKLEFLRVVHYAFGIRGQCKASNKFFLRLLKDDLLTMMDLDGSDIELSQVLYDLYGLRCSINPGDIFDHSCADSVEILDKRTALLLVDFLMKQAQRGKDLKDVARTDLKTSIEKVHGALGTAKKDKEREMNSKALTQWMKKPINPSELYGALRGVGNVPCKPIYGDQAAVANKGWFFLMGNLALSRFRSQKRPTQGPTEELNFGIAFLKEDLEYSIEKWETWFRLAQGYDSQLEDCVAWTAEKINGNQLELIKWQRHAIHCYTMAVACAHRSADATPETLNKMAEMYADFGTRIYASSRQPFNMDTFHFQEQEKVFFSMSHGIERGVPWRPLGLFKAWKLAARLYRQSLNINPDNWWAHYMLGKCLWKMYTAPDHISLGEQPPRLEELLDCLTQTIENIPVERDTRREKEPLLEPHYKLVSIVNKLVHLHRISYERGGDILRATSYGEKVPQPEDPEAWQHYILGILKVLRAADKSNWHHRIAARTAHVVYDENPHDTTMAMAARHELFQQVFTKTLKLNIWRPPNERPGRHFVYTTAYTRFFMHILVQLNDRPNLEQLVRTVRKRQLDFYEHQSLWHELVVSYIKLLRRNGQIPEGHEETIFKNLSWDEWSPRSTRLEEWCQHPTFPSILLDVLRDVIELKRLNNGLTKNTLIDDLLGDTFALMYETILPQLGPEPQPPEPQSHTMSVSHMINIDGAADHPPHPPDQPAASKPRQKGVGRRELQKRAEAAVSRPAAPVAPARSSVVAPLLQPQVPVNHPHIVIEVPRQPAAPAVQVSAPASAHPSMNEDADDENGSDLSELEDEEMEELEPVVMGTVGSAQPVAPTRPMFPNLVGKKPTTDPGWLDNTSSCIDTTDEEGGGEPSVGELAARLAEMADVDGPD